MILIASISVLFFGVVIAFSPSMILFIILRSCVAASTTALFTCGFVYCMELVGGKWSTLVSFGLEYSWALGYLTIPLIAWAVPRWDHLQLAASIPTAIFVAVMAIPSLVPESPKWLLVNGNLKEAEEILVKAEHENGRTNTQIQKVHNSTYTDQEANGEKKSQNVTVLNLFKTPSLRRCTIIMYYLWFTNNLVYYGLTFNAGKLIPGDIHTNMVISAALEFLAYSVAIVCFLYLGRRYENILETDEFSLNCQVVHQLLHDLWRSVPPPHYSSQLHHCQDCSGSAGEVCYHCIFCNGLPVCSRDVPYCC